MLEGNDLVKGDIMRNGNVYNPEYVEPLVESDDENDPAIQLREQLVNAYVLSTQGIINNMAGEFPNILENVEDMQVQDLRALISNLEQQGFIIPENRARLDISETPLAGAAD